MLCYIFLIKNGLNLTFSSASLCRTGGCYSAAAIKRTLILTYFSFHAN